MLCSGGSYTVSVFCDNIENIKINGRYGRDQANGVIIREQAE